ncbi:MAG: ATP-binding protein [Desulfocapsaceae bacterium]|nr:ATP-binding protein [Desulfocapsaceae bacterium]
MVNTPENDFNTYCGRILLEDYSDALKHKVREQMTACFSFDQINIPIMPYISAWRLDRPGIWYEYVSKRFLSLFNCGPEAIADAFCAAILDRREYNNTGETPIIKELVLTGKELDSQKQILREKTGRTGAMEAVYKVQLPDRRVLWLKDWASITTFAHDGICLSPGYLTDVSMELRQKDHLSRLNADANRDKELLVEAERSAALGQISAQVYHEIRNPVLSIGGLARRLLKKPPADPQLFLEVIAKEAERLEKILRNLFDFTRRVELAPKLSDPVQLVERVIALLQSDFDHFAVRATLTVDGPISELFIDQEQIYLALVHIIKNGLEAMLDGGTLGITIRQSETNVMITIRDSGEGIHVVHKKRVTEPFFTTKVYGTGLGLSLAQKAIDLHQGELVISTIASGGTEVTITLPRKSAYQEEA